MATYYYDYAAGSDSNDGLSIGAPKKNLPNTLLTGNTYLLRDGVAMTATADKFVQSTVNVGTWYGGKATFIGLNDGNSFGIVSAAGVNVSNIIFLGAATGNSRQVNIGSGSSDVTFTDCDFDGLDYTQWNVRAVTCTGTVTFKRCTFNSVTDDNFYGQELGTLVFDDCSINNCNVLGAFTGDGIAIGGAANVAAVYIRNTRITNYRDGKHCIIVNPTAPSTCGALVVENCELYGADTPLSLDRVTSPVVTRNKIRAYSHPLGTHPTREIFIQNCSNVLFAHNDVDVGAIGQYCVHSWTNTGTCRFENNTFAGGSQYVLRHYNGTGQLTFKNNLIDNTLATPAVASVSCAATHTLVSSNNSWMADAANMLVFGTTFYGSLAAMQGAGYEANSRVGDPLVSDANRPLPGSPLLGAGAHISYTRDLDGKQRPNPPAIGAYDVATLRRVLSTDPAA